MSTIAVAVPRNLKAKLMELMILENAKSFDELLRKMLIIYKKYKFLKARIKVRERMRELSISLDELLE